MGSTPYPYAPDLDEGTAVGLALADILDGLEYAPGHRIQAAYAGWAEPEDVQKDPAVAVMPLHGTYSASRTAPFEAESTRRPETGAGWALMQDGEWTAQAEIVVWTTDPEMRARCVRVVREALQESGLEAGNRYGRVLAIPRYFGGAARASLAPEAVRYEDSEEEDERRHRIAYMTVSVQLPMLRLVGAADLETRLVLTVGDEAISAT